jgi:conjugal transfer pilus assembly protein TraK
MKNLCSVLALCLTCLTATKAGANEPVVVPMAEEPTIVLPETATRVRLSASDVNRLVCQEEIKDVVTSKEKGVIVKISGKNAFIKFVVVKKGDRVTYSETPTEMFVICGETMFNLIAMPGRLPAQTIQLSTGQRDRVKKNLSLFDGLPFEQKILKVVQESYTEDVPESYVVKKINRKTKVSFKEIDLRLRREIEIEGEGMKVREYEATLKPLHAEFLLNERMFLRSGLAENPVAVAIDEPLLKTGEIARIFVVETKPASADDNWMTPANPLVLVEQEGEPAMDADSNTGIQPHEGGSHEF